MKFLRSALDFLTRRAWVIPLALLLLTCLHPLGFRLNWKSASQPRGLYRLTAEPWERHALVLTELRSEIARFGAERGYLTYPELAKCIAALPGDTVEVTREGLRVNGRLVPGTAPRTHDSKNRPIAAYPPGPHVVLPGTVWLYSNHIPHSWDSRYFGPVPFQALKGCLQPLLTFPRFPRDSHGEPTCNWNPNNS